ncbi:MAG: hypothetical protein ACLRQQ_10535 [Acutalibacteraceae bacterium]
MKKYFLHERLPQLSILSLFSIHEIQRSFYRDFDVSYRDSDISGKTAEKPGPAPL